MINIVNIKYGPKGKYLYIGRANKFYHLEESKWANPYVIGKDGDRKQVIEKYRLKINSQPELLRALPEIKKENFLACWCNYPHEDCHGRILIELAESKHIKNWFSNMLPMEQPLIHQDIQYKTVENFYQAMKLPKDRLDLRKEISLMSPFEAKKNIRDKTKYIWREDWTPEKSLKVMKHALKWKFQDGTDWARKLKLTKELDIDIVEWNNWGDKFFGKDIITEQGENHLGKILTQIRDTM